MNESNRDVLEELKKITRLLSILATKGLKQRDQIDILSQAGFSPTEIAVMIGTTPNTVSVTRAQLRREKSGRKRPLRKEAADD